ncbi:MAG: class I SAM-dependent methyltransferase [Clostridia bacterium]|nr:class I SAM-dependent methyltransferase [Clostridia bacterium]MBO5912214.1 class I SAM-dependent methyltransferase [Clostridia bacterium]
MSYREFARVYDQLQADVDYKARTEYLVKLFEKYDRLPTLLLDVACGTGGFSFTFAEKGVEVIGADPSPEMLGVAREKFAAAGKEILLLCQSAEELDLYGTVDGAVCCLDSLNHIVDEEELKRSVARISLFLEKDRLFIFDVNTMYKHKEVLSGNTFAVESDDVFCVWRNSECDEDGTVDISLDFFLQDEDGRYERSFEDFSERAYSDTFLKECITEAGLEVVAVLGDMSFDAPNAHEERVIYVTRRV